MTTERRLRLVGDVYLDCTGNGTLGYFAGAAYAIGREGRAAYGEKDARESPTARPWATPSTLWPRTGAAR